MNCYELGIKCAANLRGIPVYDMNTILPKETDPGVMRIHRDLGYGDVIDNYKSMAVNPNQTALDRFKALADSRREYHQSRDSLLDALRQPNIRGLAGRPNPYNDAGKRVALVRRSTDPIFNNRSLLAHEAFHIKSPVLGRSELLTRLYGGWRGPRPSASILAKGRSALQHAVPYITSPMVSVGEFLKNVSALGMKNTAIGGPAMIAATEAAIPAGAVLGSMTGAPEGQRLVAGKNQWAESAAKTLLGSIARIIGTGVGAPWGQKDQAMTAELPKFDAPPESVPVKSNVAVNRVSSGLLH